jgi:hypothetical protein
VVQQHAASFIAHTEASTGAKLPRFIKDEFDVFLISAGASPSGLPFSSTTSEGRLAAGGLQWRVRSWAPRADANRSSGQV